MSFPLSWAHQNLLFGPDERVCALYRIDTVSYPYLAERDKHQWHARLAQFAYGVGADFTLWRVSRAYRTDQYTATAQAGLDERHGDPAAWHDYLAGHAQQLASIAGAVPELYLAIDLARPAPRTPAGKLLTGTDHARRRVEHLLGLRNPRPVTRSELDDLERAEQQLLTRVQATLPVRRATTRELQWLIARSYCRGLAEPRLEPAWRPAALAIATADERTAFQPLTRSMLRVADALIDEHPNRLTVTTEQGGSHQAMLCAGALPEQAEFPGPGSELLFAPLERLDFAVDACVSVRWIDNRSALSQVRKRVIDADTTYTEQEGSTSGASWAVDENRTLARELEDQLASQAHPPLLLASISLAIGAASEQQLEERVEQLRAAYSPVHLYRPTALQRALLDAHLPGPTSSAASEWADYLTLEQFAALMPIATHHAGSEGGPYIGTTVGGTPRPVRFDTTQASRESRPPSILVCGTLGSGKTIFSQLIAMQAALRGSLVVDIDPKPDHGLHLLPELHGKVRVIELSSAERYRGLLDPLRIAPDDLREELCASYLTEILPQAPASWQTQIRKAVRQAVAERATSSREVIRLLHESEHPEAREAAESLDVWADAGLGRLAFAEPGSDAELLAGEQTQLPVTTIRAGALTLPSPVAQRSDYTQSERLAIATLKLVAAYAMRLVSGDRSRAKLLLFDEAWFLLANPDGRRLIDRLNRLGRSQNASLVLATQQLSDIGEIENLIGTRVIFGQETHAEAQRALTLLGLDPDDAALVQQIRAFRAGRCLLRDIDDRIAQLQVQVVYPHVLDALNTTPTAQKPQAVTP